MPLMEQSLGRLAREIDGATRVFDAYNLDFCCGGAQSLRAATEQAGVDAAPIVAELLQLSAQMNDNPQQRWEDASPDALIQHILDRYHAVHREQLPELIRLARKIEQVHGARADCPHGLGDLLAAMAQELESHMRKEEMVLFPMIQGGNGAMARMPIGVMRMEHDEHGVALRQMLQLTNDLTLPQGACATWQALYRGLDTFRQDLMEHIHTENNILFERFAPVAH